MDQKNPEDPIKTPKKSKFDFIKKKVNIPSETESNQENIKENAEEIPKTIESIKENPEEIYKTTESIKELTCESTLTKATPDSLFDNLELHYKTASTSARRSGNIDNKIRESKVSQFNYNDMEPSNLTISKADDILKCREKQLNDISLMLIDEQKLTGNFIVN